VLRHSISTNVSASPHPTPSFCRRHSPLKQVPAMATGRTDHEWTIRGLWSGSRRPRGAALRDRVARSMPPADAPMTAFQGKIGTCRKSSAVEVHPAGLEPATFGSVVILCCSRGIRIPFGWRFPHFLRNVNGSLPNEIDGKVGTNFGDVPMFVLGGWARIIGSIVCCGRQRRWKHRLAGA